MSDLRALRASVAGLSLLLVALLACKKEEAAGCSSDVDCKGSRVCQAGACVEPATQEPATAVKTGATQPRPAPAPRPAPVAVANRHAADGLPTVIPSTTSSPPTTAEWGQVNEEVTVRGSSAAKCKTYMLREWLRVRCFSGVHGSPQGVSLRKTRGVQAYKFEVPGNRISLVVQVKRNKHFESTIRWSSGSKDLVVDWPRGAPRPSLYLR